MEGRRKGVAMGGFGCCEFHEEDNNSPSFVGKTVVVVYDVTFDRGYGNLRVRFGPR